MSVTETITRAADQVVNSELVDITAMRNLGGQTMCPHFILSHCVLSSLTPFP